MLMSVIFVLLALTLVNIFTEMGYETFLYWEVVSQFRVGMFFECVVVMALLFTFNVLCVMYLPTIVNVGWTSLFSPTATHIFNLGVLTGVQGGLEGKIQVLLFTILMLWGSPFISYFEEELFREGNVETGDILWSNLKFGLIHMTVGLSLMQACSLGLLGLFLSWKYVQTPGGPEALLESAAYHSMFHYIVGAAFVFLVILA